MTTTQLILIWTLVMFLLAWMVTFAVLALRSDTPMDVALSDPSWLEDLPAPSRVLSTPTPSVSTPAPVVLHVMAALPRQDVPGEMLHSR